MEDWYIQKDWDEEAHRRFYDQYAKASPEKKAKALLSQASILSESEDQMHLKAAESLLLLWMAKHFTESASQHVFELIAEVSRKLGNYHQQEQFLQKIRNLEQE